MIHKIALASDEIPVVLSISDKINLFLAISSFLLAVLSIILVVITIKQNCKMIESTSRPYIVVKYETIILPDETARYVVIKNYGQTIAKNIQICCTGDTNQRFLNQIRLLNGASLAPGQHVIYYFGHQNPYTPEILNFTYSYSGVGKLSYSESVTLHMVVGRYSHRTKNDDQNEAISYALQELTERSL